MKTTCYGALALLIVLFAPCQAATALPKSQSAAMVAVLKRALPEALTNFTAIRGAKVEGTRRYEATITVSSDTFDHCAIFDFTDYIDYWSFDCEMNGPGAGPANMAQHVRAMAATIASAIPAGFTKEPDEITDKSYKISWRDANGVRVAVSAYRSGKRYDLEIEHHVAK